MSNPALPADSLLPAAEECRRGSKMRHRMFEGKMILVYLIDASEAFAGGIAISNPQVQDYFGRKFITGTVPEHPGDWTSGLRISVALDQVAHFLEFPDERDFLERDASAIQGVNGKRVQ